MDSRFEVRKKELMDECNVDASVFDAVESRLEEFMKPFVGSFSRSEPREHARTFVGGLLSDLQIKNTESIAYRVDQDRRPLQRFIGGSLWDDEPLRAELARQVGESLGEPDGVLAFDPSSFPKSGPESAGVARQWSGRLGKTDNCQVAIYLAYVSSKEHALVDTRLYLPKEWTDDCQRCDKVGVPKDRRGLRKRHELALEMLAERGPLLPHSWIAGDDEMGRPYWFRKRLASQKERYLLAVPSNTLVRDMEVDPPEYSGSGRPRNRPWQRVEKWRNSLPEGDWTKVDVRDGSKGPLIVEAVKTSVVARRPNRQEGHKETLVVIRYKDRDNRSVVKTDFYLSNAESDVEIAEFARVAKAELRIEECFRRGKSEVGLADYEVRTWIGWHHHQTLAMLAAWYLVIETRREKKRGRDTRDDVIANPRRHRGDPSPREPMRHARTSHQCPQASAATQRTRSLLPLAHSMRPPAAIESRQTDDVGQTIRPCQ